MLVVGFDCEMFGFCVCFFFVVLQVFSPLSPARKRRKGGEKNLMTDLGFAEGSENQLILYPVFVLAAGFLVFSLFLCRSPERHPRRERGGADLLVHPRYYCSPAVARGTTRRQ